MGNNKVNASKKNIVYIIPSEKFTKSYIDYMRTLFPQYIHTFFIIRGDYSFFLEDNSNVYYLKPSDLMFNRLIKKILTESTCVIISQVMGIESRLLFNQKILKKTYLQFWGGDYYIYRHKFNFFSKENIKKTVRKIIIKKCAGIANLIDGEFDDFKKIFGIKDNINHFILPVPSLSKSLILEDIKINLKNKNKKTILIGNSATKENRHKQVFDLISNCNFKNYNIICPLAYGDSKYRQEILNYGKSLFNENFLPIVSFMDYRKYTELLMTIDVAIFNNDRQQALGNIYLLMGLGKKVYLNSDVCMWTYFNKRNASIFDINDIKKLSQEDFFNFTENDLKKNQTFVSGLQSFQKQQWSDFFNKI